VPAAARKETRLTVVPGAFRLVERVGRGATSVVWRARDDAGNVIALKVGHDRNAAALLAAEALHASLSLSRHLPELRAIGLLRIDGDEARPVAKKDADALPFLALRWMEGKSLATVVPERSERVALALALARDVGEALADLHGVGLSHGDVKPANIAWRADGGAALYDLGLCGPAWLSTTVGGTPRYLGRGDRDLGDARARDLLALGIVLAEIVSPAVAKAERPLEVARRERLPAPIGALCDALLAPEPAARPSARWVADTAAAWSSSASAEEIADRQARRVRAGYLRLRRQELAAAGTIDGEVAPWLEEAVAIAEQARAVCRLAGVEPPEVLATTGADGIGPMSAELRARWLAGLVGAAAAAWPMGAIVEASEPELCAALTALARRKRPEVWTLLDVESAFAPSSADLPAEPAPAIGRLDAEGAAELCLRVLRIPPDARALETVERLGVQAPPELVRAAADALRLGGELGRARSLVRACLDRGIGPDVAADVLRRSGDLDEAARTATTAIDRGADPDGRARGCLGRIHLDRGEIDRALAVVGERPASAPAAETRALCDAARGDLTRALEHAERGLALAASPEARARLSGAVAYVQQRLHDAAGARAGFGAAVEHAVRAGAVLEEAIYRTGEAGACVDLGEIDAAVDTARRAALLLDEVLGRPAMAARAWVNAAVAFASVGARHEAAQAAERALARARAGGDRQAEAHAHWAGALAAIDGGVDAGSAVEQARRAAELAGHGLDDDAAHIQALLLVLSPDDVAAARRNALDAACTGAGRASAHARLAWWAARAERMLRDASVDVDGRHALAELVKLAGARAPVPTRGRAMHTARRLAEALGDGEARVRLEAARREAAATVLRGVGGPLAAAAAACGWIAESGADVSTPISGDQALDLQALVRALGERESLRALLDRVLDVLLLWTGAERGLLLLRGPEGRLSPRSARNLGKDDLDGEQLTVSTSLAQRALESGDAVVAVDAMQELGSSYQSVHALKLRSVLVVPLVARSEVLGVVYLDDRIRRGAFGTRELGLARSVAPVAALAIADARTQVELRRAVRRAERMSRRLEESLARKETALDLAERELAQTLHGQPTRFHYPEIAGESDAVKQMLRLVDKVAPSDIPVLLRGESGSGKELVARAIHRASPRASGPFVSENCGALPETLLESTLFGHQKGAFTGAHRTRIGLFEAADGGTLFLDEIGEMSLGMQTKLLRVLEDRLVRPVGSVRATEVDVRVVTATHRDLEKMVETGSFREDLYYRLNVIGVRIPPLRERSGDVLLLVEHFMQKHAPGRHVSLSRAARQRLQTFGWPGNVRQLENEVRRALLLSDDVIDASHLSIPEMGSAADVDVGLNVRARIDRLEVQLVDEALDRTSGNQTQAAKLLGVSRYGLHKMMRRLGIAR
jgi:transcriptional regulator with GAF, ATPase, and Fis domain